MILNRLKFVSCKKLPALGQGLRVRVNDTNLSMVGLRQDKEAEMDREFYGTHDMDIILHGLLGRLLRCLEERTDIHIETEI